MNKMIGDYETCDECKSLVDVYIELTSRRGDLIRICMNCLGKAILSIAKNKVRR